VGTVFLPLQNFVVYIRLVIVTDCKKLGISRLEVIPKGITFMPNTVKVNHLLIGWKGWVQAHTSATWSSQKPVFSL